MLLSPEELKRSGEIDPTIQEFVRANCSQPVDWNDSSSVFSNMAAYTAMQLQQIGAPESSIVEYNKDIPMRDGFQSTIKIHKPTTPPASGSPLVVLCYGGGFIAGNKDTMTSDARAFVRLFGAVVVNLSYRLAPQHKFPAGQNDCWDSIKWLAANATDIDANPIRGFIVGGASAGGTLSAVCTHLSIEEKLSPPITGQWLCVPALAEKKHVPDEYKKYFLSREHNTNDPILPAWALDALAKHTSWDTDSPLQFPILSRALLKDLPPTFIQADGMDPLRDDALIYEELLKVAGVKTRIRLYPGAPHAHYVFMPGLEISNRAAADIMMGLGWLLGTGVTYEQALRALIKPEV